MARQGNVDVVTPQEAHGRETPRHRRARRRRHRWRAVVLAAATSAVLVAVAAPLVSADDPRSGLRPTDPYRATRELRPVAGWDALFARNWARERPAARARSRSPDSWDHYSLGYSVDGLTAAYLATGKTAYVDEALKLVENVAGTAVRSSALPGSQFHDGFEGWSSQRPDVRGREVPLFESYFWRYATGVLRVIHETPALYTQPRRRLRYQRLLRFTERNVIEKWIARGAEDHVYRSRTHMAAHWALIALNLSPLTADRDDRSAYRSIVARINRDLPNFPSSLHGQLVRRIGHPGAWFWSDVWGSVRPPGQDVPHANGVVAYVVEAHDRGAGWTDRDVDGFVRTLNDVIWPRAGQVAQYVDGTGRGDGWFSDGFVKLGRYAPRLQRRLESHRPANAQFYANGALNAALLTCDRRPSSAAPACSSPLAPLRRGTSDP